MERASRTLQRIMAEALHRLPPEELPAAAWDFAAGRAVVEKTRVLGCSAQVLMIEVPDATWRAQLEAMAPQFLARLNQYTEIRRIEFQLAGSGQQTTTRPQAGPRSQASSPRAAESSKSTKATSSKRTTRRNA